MTGVDIRETRERLELSQQALAVALGVAAASVHRWETGKIRVPPFLHLALERIEDGREARARKQEE